MSDITLAALQSFQFERILNEDPVAKSMTLLGTFPQAAFGPPTSDDADRRLRAIVRIEKTALDGEAVKGAFDKDGLIDRIEVIESTDIYSWVLGWFAVKRDRDVKINIIFPATDVHVKKYSVQEILMVHETPAIYENIVEPYIMAFPPARTRWVHNILSGTSEANKILYDSSDFVILPDMKWDLTTMSSFYILAIVRDCSIRSLRDLRKSKGHVKMLKSIRTEAGNVAERQYGLGRQRLRMFVHYQPSYYHFHVHIVHANHAGTLGSTVGQAHLLDDIISLLELDTDDHPGVFQRMELTYGLGDQHGLFVPMQQLRADDIEKHTANV